MSDSLDTPYDVFLSHAAADTAIARRIAAGLEAVGLVAFYGDALQPGVDIRKAIWNAIAECRALIAIVSPGIPMHEMGLVEIGAAMGWNKPVFVIIQDSPTTNLPPGLSGFPVYPLSRIDDVIYAIRAEFEPLTDAEIDVLAEAYEDVGIAADELSQDQDALRDLAMKFNVRTGKDLSEDRLHSEIFRMRKRGRLPRLRLRKATP